MRWSEGKAIAPNIGGREGTQYRGLATAQVNAVRPSFKEESYAQTKASSYSRRDRLLVAIRFVDRLCRTIP